MQAAALDYVKAPSGQFAMPEKKAGGKGGKDEHKLSRWALGAGGPWGRAGAGRGLGAHTLGWRLCWGWAPLGQCLGPGPA